MPLLEGFCSLLPHVPQERFYFGTFCTNVGFFQPSVAITHAAKCKCSFLMAKRYTCHRQIGVLMIWFATEIRTTLPLSLSFVWRKKCSFIQKPKVPTYAIRQYFRNATSTAAKCFEKKLRRAPTNHVSELMPCKNKSRRKKNAAIFQMIIDVSLLFH